MLPSLDFAHFSLPLNVLIFLGSGAVIAIAGWRIAHVAADIDPDRDPEQGERDDEIEHLAEDDRETGDRIDETLRTF
ncbi:MAG: hypothetical protein LJE97_14670 [Betaproteobacteria bacterium]|jgi:hypothetical protein|nr:hypothetical protein [Betaproteobacteria bacterium]